MILLCTPSSEAELIVLKSILDGEDIPYYVQNDAIGSLLCGSFVPPILAKKIFVFEDDAQFAWEAIQPIVQESLTRQLSTKNESTIATDELSQEWVIAGAPC